ncbi:MAG TPA: radical SAM protein [Coriobacteriia bacterium]
MKILFLQKDTMVRIAVMLLSASLKEDGHECELLMDAAEKDLVSTAVAMRPDLIAFSCITGGQGWVLETARRVKERMDVPVLVGGPHATFFPEIVDRPEVDIVCRGEGEEAIREIVAALASHDPGSLASIPNVSTRVDGRIVTNDVRDLAEDLDRLPFPDWELYRKRYAFLVPYYLGNFPAILSRGCPHACSYCFNRSYLQLYRGKGRYVRRETPAGAVARLARMRDEFGVRRFNFVDDSFAENAAWVEEFTALYRDRVALPFICNVRAPSVTEETARMLREAGCYCLRMGIESGDERVRREILAKRVSDEEIGAAAANARRNHMKLVTYNMYGCPGESLEDALRTYELNRDLRVTFPQCSILLPYPGTPIRETAERMGLMPAHHGDGGDELPESYFVESPLKIEHKRGITNLQKLTPVCARWRMPTPVVRWLISLPSNPLYHLAFQSEYALFRLGLDANEIVPFLRFALKSRAYMARRSGRDAGSAS